VATFRAGGSSVYSAVLQQGLLSDPLDKLITCFPAYLILAGMYVPPPYTVTVNGAKIQVNGYPYADYGTPAAPDSLKTIDASDPGLGADDLAELARRGWTAHALDLRGHGGSAPADLTQTGMLDYVRDVEQVASQLPVAPVIRDALTAAVARSETGYPTRPEVSRLPDACAAHSGSVSM